MIELKRDDRHSVHMVLDLCDISTIIAALGSALVGHTEELNVVFDKSITSAKRGRKSIAARLTFNNVEEDGTGSYIGLNTDHVTIDLDEDDLTYSVEYFERALTTKAFFPAEWCHVTTGNRKTLHQIYCYLRESNSTT